MNGTKRTVSKLKKVKKKLSLEPNMAVQRELRKVKAKQESRVVSNNSIASATLLSGIQLHHTKHDRGTAHKLISTAPHSGFVEFGTGPRNIADKIEYQYSAPTLTNRLVSNIKAWMILKGVVPMTGNLNQSAFLIARRISTSQYEGRNAPPGTDPQPFFFGPMWEHEHLLRNAVRKAVKKAVR